MAAKTTPLVVSVATHAFRCPLNAAVFGLGFVAIIAASLWSRDMLDDRRNSGKDGGRDLIRHNDSAPPVSIPPGHVGPVVLGTGRLVWWTGRVAIGLRHPPERRGETLSYSALWLQDLMLTRRGRAAAAMSRS